MSLTSLEKGISLFLINHSLASDEEKIEALTNLETLLDPEIDSSLIAATQGIREKLMKQEYYEEDFDRLRFELIITHKENIVKALRNKFLETKAIRDVDTVTNIILPVIKLFEKTVNRRILFVEDSISKLLLSVSSNLEKLRKEVEYELANKLSVSSSWDIL